MLQNKSVAKKSKELWLITKYEVLWGKKVNPWRQKKFYLTYGTIQKSVNREIHIKISSMLNASKPASVEKWLNI